VVVGSETMSGGVADAVEWTQGKSVILKDASGNPVQGSATGVSNNGTIVGKLTGTGGGYDTAFSWTSTSGEATIPALSSATASAAVGVSSDGTIIAVNANAVDGNRGYIVTNGMQLEPVPPTNTPGVSSASVDAISSDGSVVVGNYMGSHIPIQGLPYEYDPVSDGFYPLTGTGGMSGEATAVTASSDGSVVVGQLTDSVSGYTFAFCWDNPSANTPATNLPFLAGDVYAIATGVAYSNTNNDVMVVGGMAASSFGPTTAFIWDQAKGTTQSLQPDLVGGPTPRQRRSRRMAARSSVQERMTAKKSPGCLQTSTAAVAAAVEAAVVAYCCVATFAPPRVSPMGMFTTPPGRWSGKAPYRRCR
jgi:uncharacterized membrane protein